MGLLGLPGRGAFSARGNTSRILAILKAQAVGCKLCSPQLTCYSLLSSECLTYDYSFCWLSLCPRAPTFCTKDLLQLSFSLPFSLKLKVTFLLFSLAFLVECLLCDRTYCVGSSNPGDFQADCIADPVTSESP